jgi:outer membrane immunogenic protein
MRKYLIAMAATATLAASPVLAADMELKAPPLPVMPPWAGSYIGINGGGGWDHNTWTFPTLQFFNTAVNQGFATNPNGGVAGGQMGYNFQFGQWVIGLEVAGDWSGMRQTLIGPVTPVFPLDSFTTKIQDYETFTARLGFAPGWSGYGTGSWLLYVKGGGASGSVNFSGLSGAPVSGVTFSTTQRLGGGTVRAGVEFMLSSHFVLGVEYDYIALFTEPFHATGTCTTPATCGAGFTTPVDVNSGVFGISSVVGRLSYKF